MREIKFRGKRKDNGEWIYGHLVKFKNTYYILSETATHLDPFNTKLGYFFIEVDPKTVGQYTGSKDKNGREIYEGDIVKAEGLISIRIRPVIFQNGMFCIPGECALLPLSEYAGEGNELEVIGNIYENPELLKEVEK